MVGAFQRTVIMLVPPVTGLCSQFLHQFPAPKGSKGACGISLDRCRLDEIVERVRSTHQPGVRRERLRILHGRPLRHFVLDEEDALPDPGG